MKLIKTTALAALLMGVAATASAQGGYEDGVDYYNADRYEEAETILKRTLDQDNTHKGIAYYYLGAIDMRRNNMAAAEQYFQQGIAADPSTPLNYVGMGEIALKKGNAKEAENYFKDAEKLSKKSPEVYTAIARAYFYADPVEYKKEIDKNISRALKESKNLNPDVYVLQGDMVKDTNVGQAAAFYNQAMEYDAMDGDIDPEGYVKYANVYIRVSPQFAIEKLEELRTKTPDSALALRELAEKYYDSEQYSKAAAVYADYIKNPNHFQKDEQRFSQLLYFDKKYPQSLSTAKNVLSQDPTNYYMYRMVMLNDAELGNNEEAAEYGAKLFATPGAELTTTDYNTYAKVLNNLGRFGDAIQVYEQGYNANPEKNADMLASIAGLYIDREDIPNAVKYQEMFDATPNAKLTDKYDLAKYYGAMAQGMPEGSPERADAINKGIKIIDDNLDIVAGQGKGSFLFTKARMILTRDLEPNQELIDTYQQMIDTYGGDSSLNVPAFRNAYLYQVLFYAQQGMKAEATAALDSLKALDPAFPNLDQLEKLVAGIK